MFVCLGKRERWGGRGKGGREREGGRRREEGGEGGRERGREREREKGREEEKDREKRQRLAEGNSIHSAGHQARGDQAVLPTASRPPFDAPLAPGVGRAAARPAALGGPRGPCGPLRRTAPWGGGGGGRGGGGGCPAAAVRPVTAQCAPDGNPSLGGRHVQECRRVGRAEGAGGVSQRPGHEIAGTR